MIATLLLAAAFAQGAGLLPDVDAWPRRNPPEEFITILLKAMNREPAAPELAGRIRRYLRRAEAWQNERAFPEIAQLALSPWFTNKFDEIYQEADGRKATSFELIRHAADYSPRADHAYWRLWVRRSLALPTRTFRGKCVDLDDKPLEGVFVSTPEAESRSLADGSFELKSPGRLFVQPPHHMDRSSVLKWEPEGIIRVYAEQDGRVPRITQRWDSLKANVESEPLTFQMPPAKTMQLTMRDPAGKPVENAQVRYVAMDGQKQNHCWFAATDRTGAATLEGLPDGGRCEFVACEHPLYGWTHGGRLELVAKEALAFVLVAMASGQVIDEAGVPVAGAEVMIVSEVNYGRAGAIILTDPDGKFELGYRPEAALVVRADHPKLLRGIQALDQGAEKADGNLRVVLKKGQFITGTVVDADDGPVADCYVGFAARPGKRDAWHLDRKLEPRLTVTDAHGEFQLGPYLEDETYEVVAIQDYPTLLRAECQAKVGGEPCKLHLPVVP